MARITLRDYNREIEELIEGGQNEEAIAHCQHILQDFPKHLATHRLLGKAYLELQRFDEAASAFRFVLDAVPDDFVAHLGMSVIREHEGDLDASLWHMERAFDVQPANAIIQGELRRLSKERDGFEPQKIQLTRGALARMYAKGDLYTQAIAELRAALAEEPNRPDLQIILAKMYARSGQLIEAAEACSSLLSKLPDCLEANYLLGDILSRTERAAEARAHYQRAAALDPYAAHLSFGQADPEAVPDDAVMLERYEISAFEPVESLPVEDKFEEGMEEAPEAGTVGEVQLYEEEPLPPLEGMPAGVDKAPMEPEPAAAPPAGDIPDWMQSAGWEPASGPEEEVPLEFEGEEKLAGDEGEELVRAEIPDWLKPLAPSEAEEDFQEEAEEGELLEEAMSWSGEAGTEHLEEGERWPEETPPVAETSPPEWLDETGKVEEAAPPPEEQPAAFEVAGEEPGVPEWLAQPDDRAPEWQGPPEEEEPGPEAEMPEWLKAAEEGLPEPAEEIPSWMKAREEQTFEEGEGLPAGEEFPGGGARIYPFVPESEAESAQAEAFEQAGQPEWFPEEIEGVDQYRPEGQGLSEPAGYPGQEEEAGLPDWLRETSAEIPEEYPSAAGEPAGEMAGEAEVPEWLQSVSEEPSLEEMQPEEEIETPFLPEIEETAEEEVALAPPEVPDWLRSALEEQEQAQVEQPEDLPEWLRSSIPEGFPEEPPPIVGDTRPVRVGHAEEFPEEEVWQELADLEAQEQIPAVGEWAPAGEPEEAAVEIAPEEPEEAEAERPQAEAGLPGEEFVPETESEEEEAEAIAWLESLAARQGVQEDELLTRPEERPESIPEWLQQSVAEAGSEEAEAAQALAAGEELELEQPAWPPEAEIGAPPEAEEVSEPAAELPGWLRDFVEEEPPLEEAVAAPEEATPPEVSPVEEVAPLEPAAPPEETPAEVLPEEALAEVEPGGKPPLLQQAWGRLVEGELSAALDLYHDLIRREQFLDQVIHDLREAAFLYPQELPLHQALGDAYLRANRLQEALDAYNKAEDLLK